MIASGSGLAVGGAPDDAALDASLDALAASGVERADVALVFVSSDCGPRAHELLHAVRRTTGAPVVLPLYGGRRGHPVIFSAAVYHELLHASLDQGARAVVWAHNAEVQEIHTTEEGCVLNLNDPNALTKLTGHGL